MSWKFNTSGGGIVEGGDGPCSSRDALGAAVSSHNGSYSYNRTSTPPRWSDINARVKEMRQTYSQLFVKTPTNIKFRLISDDCLRIYFLLCPAQGREATLFYADLNLMTNNCSQLSVHEVLDTTTMLIWRRTSREEQLLSERRRCSVWGITHYQLHPESGTLVFPAASTIFHCQHPIVPTEPVTPKELSNNKIRLNPQLCPTNPQLMAFSASGDVYVYNSKTGCEYRVSHCHGGSRRLDQDPLSAGVPAYVIQEEFFRYQGYWWQPVCRDGVHRLLYEEVDESKVLIVQFMSHDQSSPEEFRFPRAGANNALSRLRMVELSPHGSVLRVLHLVPDLNHLAPWHQYLVRVGWTPCGQYVWCQLLERRQKRLDLLLLPLSLFVPPLFIPTTSSHQQQKQQQPSSQHHHLQQQPQQQQQQQQQQQHHQQQQPQSQQPPPPPPQQHHHQQQHHQQQQGYSGTSHLPSTASSSTTTSPQQQAMTPVHQPSQSHSYSQQQQHQQQQEEQYIQQVALSCHQNGHITIPYTVLSEMQEHAWIDVHNLLYWFKNEEGPVRTFIWGSEESGHRHLYLYRVRLAGNGAVHVQQKTALTMGDWTVLSKGLWVDELRGLVYFMALKDTPLEHHLYVTSMVEAATGGGSSGVVQRLTALGYSHNVFLNPECQVFVTSYSSINFPGTSQVYRIYPPTNPNMLVSAHITAELLPHPASEGLRELLPVVVPEMLPVELACGIKLYAMLFKPHNYVAGRKYPTVLHIYGGPQVQLVTNTFKGCRHMRNHMLTSHGMCVVSIDSRGSDNRGVAFQSHIKNRMGTVEIADQVEALKLLADRYSLIDMSRVGVFGWSYGGYLSLMAIAQRGDLFKVAVAGAPVVNWSLYDTGYTERYMDTPEKNITGYKNSSVLSFIKNFPDEEGRLLIVQGIIDENVHFCHTSTLVQHLVNAGKPYQLQVYPRERHCLRQLDSNEHYETQLLHFLLKGL